MNECELGRLDAQRNALGEQLVGVTRCVPDETVSAPFLAGLGVVATDLCVTSAAADFS